jgi:hypothetical protein
VRLRPNPADLAAMLLRQAAAAAETARLIVNLDLAVAVRPAKAVLAAPTGVTPSARLSC